MSRSGGGGGGGYGYYTVTVSSLLKAPKAVVWSQISNFKGVNYELSPILQMTCPEEDTKLTAALITPEPLFRSWLLLFGVLPIEYDLVKIESVDEGTGFKERSSMALMSNWNHDRALEEVCADGSGYTEVTDTLSFKPRAPFFFLGYLFRYIVKFLFTYRHNRLVSLFGGRIVNVEMTMKR